ncbi:unnamed protein product [Rotaria magnacalcarata]|uniref:Uncharacterized protein n=1 Tax=Rotaria magnacalcarata TaxID=392030 RepID=A0A819L135_9BILA|nr:unnamed protein product [Rotaria magnacalcarata]CAF3956201.1 unnamed protein product [Rotaria magnacalcarata]
MFDSNDFRTPQFLSKSEAKQFLQHLKDNGNLNSSEEGESDSQDDDTEVSQYAEKKENEKLAVQKFPRPISLVRFVSRLNGRHSLSKMRNDEEILTQVMAVSSDNFETRDITEIADDSDDDINDVEVPGVVIKTDEHQNIDINLNNIRQKTLEYDQKQIKRIQFVNAGYRNLKIVNNHPINSSTCTIV